MTKELQANSTQSADSINQLRARINQFVEARNWAQFHSPKNLAMAMIVEAGEVVEHFQWMTEQESRNLSDETKEKVGQELSDTFVYLLRIAEVCEIDLIKAANKKIDLNAEKYPIEKVKGSNAKYTTYQS